MFIAGPASGSVADPTTADPHKRLKMVPRSRAAGETTAAPARDTSAFVGVNWDEQSSRWKAVISHDGKKHILGSFVDEHDAARAFDAAARRLRPKGKAHGARSGTQWLRLNFPTDKEEAYAVQQGMTSPGGSAAAHRAGCRPA